MANSIYWHDYETFGVDPRRDRAAQFAGVRTDEELNIIGDPLVLYCRPAPDMLPHPQSCLITGITPALARDKGLPEAEFIRRIHDEFSQPQTCVAGYNNLRFDDELTRQLLYRNFYDPYEREYRNGNSRWDIIDMVRLCAALRPEGIEWPRREDGNRSFRLGDLCAANGISHDSAHDALSDVLATIALAKLIRERQPKLYDYVFRLRAKAEVEAKLDIVRRTPVIHVSSMYPGIQGCMALVAPLTRHPIDRNGVLVYDLRQNPEEWMALSAEDIRRRLFTRREELQEGESRIGLKVLHSNRCPVVAPASLLTPELAAQWDIDMAQARRHWQLLVDSPQVVATVASAYDDENRTGPGESDPDFMIYGGGFFGANDKKTMAQIRASQPRDLIAWLPGFADPRLEEMLFRYRARNYPETLNQAEQERWEAYRHEALHRAEGVRGAGVGLAEFERELAQLREQTLSASQLQVLDELEQYVRSLVAQRVQELS